MARSCAIRSLLAALLLVGQFASVSLAAEAAAQGARCPVHTALASEKDQASGAEGHHGHAQADDHANGSEHEHPGDNEDNEASPHFSFACCAACAAAVNANDMLLQAPDWIRKQSIRAVRSLEPGELPSTDPPPRILL